MDFPFVSVRKWKALKSLEKVLKMSSPKSFKSLAQRSSDCLSYSLKKCLKVRSLKVRANAKLRFALICIEAAFCRILPHWLTLHVTLSPNWILSFNKLFKRQLSQISTASNRRKHLGARGPTYPRGRSWLSAALSLVIFSSLVILVIFSSLVILVIFSSLVFSSSLVILVTFSSLVILVIFSSLVPFSSLVILVIFSSLVISSSLVILVTFSSSVNFSSFVRQQLLFWQIQISPEINCKTIIRTFVLSFNQVVYLFSQN